jgi:hypothetical protein
MLHVLAQVLVCKSAVSTTSMTKSSIPQASPVADLAVEINGDPTMRHFVEFSFDTLDTIDPIFYPLGNPQNKLSIMQCVDHVNFAFRHLSLCQSTWQLYLLPWFQMNPKVISLFFANPHCLPIYSFGLLPLGPNGFFHPYVEIVASKETNIVINQILYHPHTS